MANGTIYPYGTDGELPSSIGLVNDFVTGGVDKALTAEAGKRLYDEIFTYPDVLDLTTYTRLNYYINPSSLNWLATSSTIKIKCLIIPIGEADRIKITMSNTNGRIAFLKSNTITVGSQADFATGYNDTITLLSGTTTEYNSLSDATYLYIVCNNSSGEDVLDSYEIIFSYEDTSIFIPKTDIVDNLVDGGHDKPLSAEQGKVLRGKIESFAKAMTFSPKLINLSINSSGVFSPTYYETKFWSTPRYIKVGDEMTLVCSASLLAGVAWYGSDYALIILDSNISVSSSPIQLTPPDGAKFFRVRLSNGTNSSSSTNIPRPTLTISGNFGDIIDTACPRPTGGYVGLTVPVMVFDPLACDSETDSVQDSGTMLSDHGVLALPTQYSPEGNPVRLIIYCHGAAVNYEQGTIAFDSTDLDPTYWLSEGCAVMDMEGNPYDNTNEHFCIPQAYQCYKAAYEFVVNNYNVRKDGVYLGGRSMGGLMTLDILSHERDIPVIAACPNVPSVVPTWYWNYMDSTRKSFCATHMGFVGTAPAWTGTSPIPSGQWQFLQDNFDRLAMSSPFWRMITNLPSKETLFNGTNVSKSSTDNSAELTAYADCRIHFRAPVKLFAVKDDAVAIYQRNALILEMVAHNSGQIFALRFFESGGHHYDTQNAALQVPIVNSYGDTITTSVVYVEMLRWWKQWDNN